MQDKKMLSQLAYLREEISRKRLLLYIGAGCSVWAGLPTWSEMLRQISDKWNIKTLESNPLRLASRLERDIKKLPFRDEICRILTINPSVRTELHDTIALLPLNTFITSNYDTLIESSLARSGFPVHVIRNDIDIPAISSERKTVVKIHGDIDSPASLIITNYDYQVYPELHKGFVEWIKAKFSENTVLFLGTSFDDPRLRDVDDSVFRLFGTFRRPPCIVLKKPAHPMIDITKQDSVSQENFEIVYADYKAYYEELKERGFHILEIDSYEELPSLIKHLIDTSQKTEKSTPQNTYLIEEYTSLQIEYQKLLDDKLNDLVRRIKGESGALIPMIAWERAEDLIKYIDDNIGKLSNESLLEGYLTLTDTAMNTSNDKIIETAREYFEKVQQFYQRSAEPSPWTEKIKRVEAKLLFREGKKEEALQRIKDSEDPFSQALWLSFLLDLGSFSEVVSFIEKTTLKKEWAPMAFEAFLKMGDLDKAEQIYNEARTIAADIQREIDWVDARYASALCNRALELSGAREGRLVVPYLLSENAKALCMRIKYILSELRRRHHKIDVQTNLWLYVAVEAEMLSYALLGEWDNAKECALEVLPVRPLTYSAAHILGERISTLSKEERELFIHRLKSEDDSFEALIFLALAQCELVEEKENAWMTIEKAQALADSEKECKQLATTAFDIAVILGMPEKGLKLAETILLHDSTDFHLIRAQYETVAGNREKAQLLLDELLKRNDLREIHRAVVYYIKGQLSQQSGDFSEARSHFVKGLNIFPLPWAYQLYMRILIHENDNIALYQCCREMESLGLYDESVQYITAQTTRNLRYYTESEKIWHQLSEKHPLKIEYARGLASVLSLSGKVDEAIKTLESYAQNSQCTEDLVKILYSAGLYQNIYDILKDKLNEFNDNPSVLMIYLDSCFRTGKEEDTGVVLKRLDDLKREGKISDKMLRKVDMEEAKQIFQEQWHQYEETLENYRYARLPRSLFSTAQNTSLYFDWAVRTQEIDLSADPLLWTPLTVYCSDRIRDRQGNNSSVPYGVFECNTDVDEIVIDDHALITLHRLDLLPLLTRHFSSIHIPSVYKEQWKNELKTYQFRQPSREKAWREIVEWINRGMIKTSKAPPHENSESSIVYYDLSLARLEQWPYIDNYRSRSAFSGFADVTVLRLKQVLTWLYRKGRLNDEEFQKLIGVTEGDEDVYQGDFFEILNTAPFLLVEQQTIETLFWNNLHRILKDTGITLCIEYHTEKALQMILQNLQFSGKVESWHKELLELLEKEPRKFIFEESTIEQDSTSAVVDNHISRLLTAAVHIAKKHKISLLTDDRFIQRFAMYKGIDNIFDTSALLSDLHKKEMITSSSYAEKFLQLCKWRYRFLLPEPELLLYLAEQYRHSIPCAGHTALSCYALDCMRDPGLNYSIINPEAQFPLAVSYQRYWERNIIEFLCRIWEDEKKIFSDIEKESLTCWALMKFIPPVPFGISQDIREHLQSNTPNELLKFVFLNALTISDPRCLAPLTRIICQDIQLHGKNPQITMLSILEDMEHNSDEKLKKQLRNRVIKSFFGFEDAVFNDEAVPYARRIGIDLEDINDSENPEKVELKSQYNNTPLINNQVSIIETPNLGPVTLVVPTTSSRAGYMLVPHHEVLNDSIKSRSNAIERLFKNDEWITPLSKEIVNSHRTALLNDKKNIWEMAAVTLQKQLLNDCRYSRKLLAIALEYRNGDLIIEIMEHVLHPSYESIWSDIPLFLNNIRKHRNAIEEIENMLAIPDLTLDSSLDFYCDKLGFIPLNEPLDPWNVILKRFISLKNTSDGIDYDESLHLSHIAESIIKWMENCNFPDEYIVGIRLILTLRAYASEKSNFTDGTMNSFFRSESYYECLSTFIKSIVTFIRPRFQKQPYIGERKDVSPLNLREKRQELFWILHLNLSEHFLRHIDIVSRDKSQTSSIPVIAWYLSRQLCKSIQRGINHWSMEQQASWLENHMLHGLEITTHSLAIKHSFYDTAQNWSATKFQTIFGKNPFAGALFSLLSPGEKADTKKNINPFYGTVNPVRVFSDETIELFFGSLRDSPNILPEEILSGASILWSISPGKSIPVFIRKYYGDAYKYLGRRKRENIEFAEYLLNVAQNHDKLEKELENALLNKEGQYAVLFMNMLLSLIYTQEGGLSILDSLLNNDDLVAQINALDEHSAYTFTFILIHIFERLCKTGTISMKQKFMVHLNRIDPGRFSQEPASALTTVIVNAVLFSGEITLLRTLKQISVSNKNIYKSLGELKYTLENMYGDIPPEFRDRVKMIFSELTDIPVFKYKESDSTDD